jgi:exo-beta-1,3-glucanase (GH17 family)
MTHQARRNLLLIALLAAGSLLTFLWWRQGRPVELADAAVARISCVSYSPSSDPQESMRNDALVISPERIERDLRILAERFDCVRTYSQAHGLDAVPRIAHRLGMQTLLGIWLGRDPIANEQEIQIAIRTVARDREAIRAVIVGNEVLLRGELTAADLAGYLQRVHAATQMPVTYADVWEFWRRAHAKLSPYVSFMTIHILPYWEDEPVRVDQAVAHVRQIYSEMRTLFPNQPVLIGETGWPSVGRQRRGAVPSRVNQIRFIREFLNAATAEKIPYNVIEAFDQPWKRLQEGTVGGYWGIYDSQRRAKMSLQGPVAENPDWLWGPAGGALAALVSAAALLIGGWRPRRWGTAVFLAASYAASAALALQVRMVWTASRSGFEWFLGGACTLSALSSAILIAHALAGWVDGTGKPAAAGAVDAGKGSVSGKSTGEVASLPEIHSWATLRSAPDVRSRWLGGLRFGWLFAASLLCLLLVYDSRYRDFPVWLFGPVVFGYVSLRLLGAVARTDIEERLMAIWLAGAAVLICILERPENLSADAWAGLCVLFAATVLVRPGSPKLPATVPSPG